MKKQDFYAYLGYIEAAMADDIRTTDFIDLVHKLIEMLDETDQDDYFSTEGWKHLIGWDD